MYVYTTGSFHYLTFWNFILSSVLIANPYFFEIQQFNGKIWQNKDDFIRSSSRQSTMVLRHAWILGLVKALVWSA